MTGEEKRLRTEEKRQKIRERYKGIDKEFLEVIPAKEIVSLKEDTSYKRVAAYCRVSTDDPNQTSSYELQKNHYEEYIKDHPGWALVGIYADEGISGTSLTNREEFNRMLNDCNAGKIDLIVTKSISRFARNTVDAISTVRQLAQLKRPVGVLFETENLYTLDQTSEIILTVLSAAAQEESHTKSEIMNISIEHRFSRGIFLTPELLGYDKDEDGNLVINSAEAETVKVIFYLYLNGFSISEIAEILTEYGRKTKLGNTEWSPSSIRGILQNERHCGDVLARKTWTPSFLNHKPRKNRNDRNQYLQRNHHEPIIDRKIHQAANRMQAHSLYRSKNRPLPVMSVIDEGILKGYVPVDKDWTGFSPEEYRSASESVYEDAFHSDTSYEAVREDDSYGLDLSGYEIVRAQFFATMRDPAMTISVGKMRFNTACLKKFSDVEYVELLLNTVHNCIAIRPCEKENPNAIRWGRLKESRWVSGTVSCRGLSQMLFEMFDWDKAAKYRFRGEYIENEDGCLMLFQLEDPEMIRVEEIVLPPQEPEKADSEGEDTSEELVIKRKILIYPDAWQDSFGPAVGSLSKVQILVQQNYGKGWDILRPARNIEEIQAVTDVDLQEIMGEAERIIEGWSGSNG